MPPSKLKRFWVLQCFLFVRMENRWFTLETTTQHQIDTLVPPELMQSCLTFSSRRLRLDGIECALFSNLKRYATTIRDSKRARERSFLKKIYDCVSNGGKVKLLKQRNLNNKSKVLIPVFALGRAQELCILVETYWEHMNLKVPIYFSSGVLAFRKFLRLVQ